MTDQQFPNTPNTQNLLWQEIQRGESKVLELKSQLPQGEQIAKTVIAFANGSGGKLVIGVNDDLTLVGIGGLDIFELQDEVASIIHSSCHPSLVPEMYIENVNGYELLVIEVFRSPLMPYYLKSKGRDSGTYVRIGASNRPASPEHIQSLELQRLNLSYDEQLNLSINFDSLDLTPLTQRFEKMGKTLDHEKLSNLKLIGSEGGKLFPSHGLLILLGHYEHVETKCALFKGTTMTVFLDKKEYTNDLFSQLESAELFIQNHLKLKVEILGLQSTQTPEIPTAAIREVLINAYVHRDYSNFGRDIKIGIYDDALNVVSPGGLPNGLTTEDIQQGRSEIRNRVIARVFKELNYIEQWGSGIARVKQLCTDAKLPTPKVTETGDSMDWLILRDPDFVDMRNDGISDGISDEISDGINDGINDGVNIPEKQSQLLDLIRNNPESSIPDYAQKMDVGTATIERYLKWLKGHKCIVRHGAKKDGYWEVLV